MPLVEAFGYTNVQVEGYEADDVIAIAHRRAPVSRGIPVMVVSGDRDVYQLVGDGVRVMTTSRGITDTKIYDREAVIERYGVPPELVTDLIGLKGDTSDNIPGVPGIGEKTASAAAAGVRLAGGGAGERREGLRREAQAEPDRARRRRPRLEAAGDRASSTSRPASTSSEVMASEPDRAVLREFMREFELRAIMERLEEGLPEGEELPGRSVEHELEIERGRGDSRRPGGEDAGRDGDLRRPPGRRPTGSGSLSGDSSQDELAVALRRADAAGRARRSSRSAAAATGCSRRPRGRASSCGSITTRCWPRTCSIRRGADYDLVELAADAGLGRRRQCAPAPPARSRPRGSSSWEPRPSPGSTPPRRLGSPGQLAELQRSRLEELELAPLMSEVELPLVEVLAAMEREGLKLDAERLAEVGEGFGERIDTLEAEIYELAGGEFTIGSPQQVGKVLFEDLGLTRKRRGKTGYSTDARVLAQIRDEHPIVEKIESWRELTQAQEHLPGHAAGADRSGDRPHPHHLQPGIDDDRAALQHQPEPAEHPDPDRDRPPGPRLLRRRARRPPALGRLQPGRAAGARPRRRARRC